MEKASFLGVGQFGYVLEQIGFEKKEKIPELINILSHKDIYTYESEVIGKDNKNLIIDILNKLQAFSFASFKTRNKCK
jgi:hypothetical protein